MTRHSEHEASAAGSLVPTSRASSLAFPTIETPDVLRAWLSGRTARTLAAYRADLDAFRAYLDMPTADAAAGFLLQGGRGHANHVAGSFRAYLMDKGLAPATVNRRLAALRSLVRVAGLLGLVSWTLDVVSVKTATYRDTRGPGRGVIGRILADLGKREDAAGRRDYAIVRCLYDLGLRRGELVGLDLEDVDIDGGRLRILGKGRTEKESLTLPTETADALSSWLAIRGQFATSGPLFFALSRSAYGKRLTGHGVAWILQQLGEPLGLHIRPHGIRHTAITDALDIMGGDVRTVQRFSRHRNINTLTRYDDNRKDLGGDVARMIVARMAQAGRSA